MSSIAIMTIVVVAMLTVTIFALAWVGYSLCIKKYKKDLDLGKYDMDLCNEHYNNKKNHVVAKAISFAMTLIVLAALLTILIMGIIFASSKEGLTIGGKTALVIKTGSMSKYYDDNLEQKYNDLGYNKDFQFGVGDICIFEKTDSLKVGEVYAYSYDNIIITHRLIDTKNVYDDDGNLVQTYYVFRGDNNPSQDQTLITSDKILYHYTNSKIPKIGLFILYAKSYMGIWALFCVVAIIISSDIVLRKIQQLNGERYSRLGGAI
ncbi:MAG: hypothetical protein J6W64_04005 [Bacilli bacterium]|nr:hypothetical protein [Bacilli bacterium]